MKVQALALGALGWRLIPLHYPETPTRCSCGSPTCFRSMGKHPRTRRGLKDATSDEGQIREWWSRWPRANIAVVTGVGSGLLVVDIDGPKGERSATELDLPPTVEARTGRKGGRHLFYACAEEVRSTKGLLGDGIDTRCRGGYVVAPPSLHRSGRRYWWTRSPRLWELTEAPGPLLKHHCALSPPQPERRGGEIAQGGVFGGVDGSRSGVDARRVYGLVQRGLTDEQILKRFRRMSDKYRERAAASPESAEAYFLSTVAWARKQWERNRREAVVESAALEVLGASYGRAPLTRIHLDLRVGRDVLGAQLAVPEVDGEETARAEVFALAAPELDVERVHSPSGHNYVKRLEGSRLEVAISGSRVVWLKKMT